MIKEFKDCSKPFFIETTDEGLRIEFYSGGATRQEVEEAFRLASEWEDGLKVERLK